MGDLRGKATNLYTVLGLSSPTSQTLHAAVSEADVRQAVRRALLRSHPDKLSFKSKEKVTRCQDSDIDRILLARDVLLNPHTRREHDRSILSSAEIAPATLLHLSSGAVATTRDELDTIDLDDMLFDEDSQTYRHSCRCGNLRAFSISEDELGEVIENSLDSKSNASTKEVILSCEGCSTIIRVTFAFDE